MRSQYSPVGCIVKLQLCRTQRRGYLVPIKLQLTNTILTELPLLTLVVLVCVGTGVGVLIGSVGVGGILMVPALIYLAGIDIHIAIASCLFSYAFNGLIGACLYARQGSIRWSSGLWLCAGAMPGAWLGATLVNQLAGVWVALIIATFVLFAAFNSIRSERNTSEQQQNDGATDVRSNKPLPLLSIGLITGAGSALSGSGGPLILVPALVWLKWPVLTAVGLGQLIQIPISLLADVANFQAGTIDVPLGLGIAATVTAGVALGARIAHRQPAALLRKVVIMALLLAAAWMILHSAMSLLAGN